MQCHSSAGRSFRQQVYLLSVHVPRKLTTGPSGESPEWRQALQTSRFYAKANIVLAMVTQGQLWKEDAPDQIIIGNGHYLPVEELRRMHAEGNLQVLGETAPNYQGLLPTDPSLTPYFDLAEELNIPMAFHMFPGGPPGKSQLSTQPMHLGILGFIGKTCGRNKTKRFPSLHNAGFTCKGGPR